jgi:hypothetical protein
MPAPAQFFAHSVQLRPHPSPGAVPQQHEPPLLRYAANVRQAEEVEGARLAEPTLPLLRRCKKSR